MKIPRPNRDSWQGMLLSLGAGCFLAGCCSPLPPHDASADDPQPVRIVIEPSSEADIANVRLETYQGKGLHICGKVTRKRGQDYSRYGHLEVTMIALDGTKTIRKEPVSWYQSQGRSRISRTVAPFTVVLPTPSPSRVHLRYCPDYHEPL